ncbi:14167_t:CDS:1 [Ambispora leptoticha]|uniref:14167_t:CDS:1 n=1 Tax=Ambispora leptoticha TaxID=144679 RepID=A0A9N8Z8E3_9GLOM|nr:14167_t:CDS:1 [Ambispora leptoticha]
MLSDISPTPTMMEETLATSTASSNPNIFSLLSPNVQAQFDPSPQVPILQTTSPSSPPPTFTEVSYSPLEENTIVDIPMETDFDPKPYGCGIDGCNYTYNNSSGLFYHSKSAHPEAANDRPFQCAMPGCNKKYKNINGLEYHIKYRGSSEHKNDVNNQSAPKPYVCKVVGCKRSYKNQNGLTYHMENAHNNLNNSGSSIDASRKSINVATNNNTTQLLSSNSDNILRTFTTEPSV